MHAVAMILISGREEQFYRQTHMHFTEDKVKLVMVLILVFNVLTANGKCAYNETEKCVDGSCRCLACHPCPLGQGLYPQCGNPITENKTILKCMPCKSGLEYSAENSIAPCRPCQLCGGKKVLRNCTATQNAECSKECKVGYEMDPIFGLCEPVVMVPITTKPTTIDHQVKSIVQATNTTVTEPPAGFNTSYNESKTENPSGKPPQETKKESLHILTGLGFFFTLVLLIIITLQRKKILKYIKRTLGHSRNRSGTDDLDGLLLKDISHELAETIGEMISRKSKKGWKQIGYEYDVSKNKLDEINTRCTWAGGEKIPGEYILEFLNTSKPALTIKEFLKVLKAIKREDVIKYIKKEFQNDSSTDKLDIYQV